MTDEAQDELDVIVVQPLTKTCTNCDGQGTWPACDPETGTQYREDGLPVYHECQRCKGTGREPAPDEVIAEHEEGKDAD